MALRRSPLHAEHIARGARIVEFGGWEMPIQYSSVLEEHRACRHDVVAFDVSHLGTVAVTGSGALPLLQWAFSNDLERIAPGRAQYTHLLDPVDGSVVDDIIVWWLAADEFLVMPNASNTDSLTAALDAPPDAARFDGVAVRDVTTTRAIVAVQGPNARSLLAGLDEELAAVGHFDVVRARVRGADCVIAGTGYTGEDGVEIQVPAAHAPALWSAILAAGATPAGLGARDTLRLEAGFPLHGHELGPGITPLQAGLGWVVRFDKGEFRGRDALLAERARGVARKLVGLIVEGRQPPRAGSRVIEAARDVGAVTSGNFSPELGSGIGLALVERSVALDSGVEIDVRGRMLAARVVKPPFVTRGEASAPAQA